MSEQTEPTFRDRRPCCAILNLYITMGPNAWQEFNKSIDNDRQHALHELSSEFGSLQNLLQRFMWDEGMTSEVGLGASLMFTEITSNGFKAQIYLHSDLDDVAGFYADFDAMINGIRCRCWDKAFELSWRPSWVAEQAKEHIAHFVGAAHV